MYCNELYVSTSIALQAPRERKNGQQVIIKGKVRRGEKMLEKGLAGSQ